MFRVFDDVICPLSDCRPGPSTRAVEGIETRLHRSGYPWLSQGARVLNAAEIALSDYAPMSQGNLWRGSTAIDWAQSRVQAADAVFARRLGDQQTRTSQLANRGIDGSQHGFWEAYRLGQRVVIRAIDEKLINGVENATDRLINARNTVPAEILVRQVIAPR